MDFEQYISDEEYRKFESFVPMNEKAVWKKVDPTRKYEGSSISNRSQEGFINKGAIAFCFTETKIVGEDKYVVKIPRDRVGG